MSPFRTVSVGSLPDPFTLIHHRQLLITVANGTAANAMTASWGGLGVLWNKPVSAIFVRPQRYTYTLLEQAEAYSLAVLPSDNRAPLTYCGTHSGRDGDKLSAAALSVFYHEGTPCIEQAEFVIVCRKLHAVSFAPDQFTERSLLSYYTANDFHRQYIGEITAVLTK
jgi:flavin reductase (DIM6/NTAB) family NADH-FMN oxidoreductase RutF